MPMDEGHDNHPKPKGIWVGLNEKTGHPEYNDDESISAGCAVMWIAWACVICGMLAGIGVLVFQLAKVLTGG